MKSFLVYKFTCASCSYSYIGKTCRHFKTRIEKHIKKVNKSHIFKHIHSTATCFDSYNSHCFKIIDMVNSKFDLKMKEVVHINWRKPNLNVQQNHFALTHSPIASVPLVIFCLCLLVCLFLHFSFVCYFHYLWHWLLAYFTVLITFRYYFILLQCTLYHTFVFHLLFSLSLHLLSASFTVLITFCHYLISL